MLLYIARSLKVKASTTVLVMLLAANAIADIGFIYSFLVGANKIKASAPRNKTDAPIKYGA